MYRRAFVAAGTAMLLAGCAGQWKVDYASSPDPAVSRTWRLKEVIAIVPDSLKVSDANSFAPSGDIVWHGEPYGDRRAQVAKMFEEGIALGAGDLRGERPVTITAEVQRFHGVTPAAVARAPSAVYSIIYMMQVIDAASGSPLTEKVQMEADLEGYVGAAAIAAAISGDTERKRVVAHIANVTRGWLGFGPDQRRTFSGIGR